MRPAAANTRRTGVLLVGLTVLLAGAIASAAGAARPSTAWTIETVDADPYAFQGPALVLDAAGRPHIGYGSFGFGMRYAYKDASGWHKETIEGGAGVGFSDTSIVLDAAGHPHISYWDYTHGLLKYAWYNGTGWFTETVDSGGQFSSLALDLSERPCIAYFGPDVSSLRYAHLNGTDWLTETVESVADYFYYGLSMAMDSGGEPHLLYAMGGLKYAYHDAGGWHIELLDIHAGGGDLALDSLGQPRASFTSSCAGGGVGPHGLYGLCYAYRDGSGWHVSSVDTSGDTGWYSSLALDAANRPHISYYQFANQDLQYAVLLSGAVWMTETVDANRAGGASSLALDGNGQPHIAYEGNFNLKYASGGPQPTGFVVFLPEVVRR